MNRESEAGPFSEHLKSATWAAHQDAEQHGFTQALLDGRLGVDGYAAMAAQHYFAYLALEEVGRSLGADPVAGPFVTAELERVPALERDLAHLYGPSWTERISPTLPTTTYVARIRQMADDPAGFVAHHYTRYLGDVSGGQFIRKVAARTYAFAGTDGTSFYDFSALGSLPGFKRSYRERLDALRLDETGRRRMIRETGLAYQLNTEVLADLGRTYTAESAA